MVELADTTDLGSVAERLRGSTPLSCTEHHMMTAIELQEHLNAWEEYDTKRGVYEYRKAEWKNARTTYDANSCVAEARSSRDGYENALHNPRKLGYDPSGEDPVPADYFKDE